MLTRFSKTTCPKCGHVGKPRAKEPGSDGIETALSAIPVVRTAGLAYTGWRKSQATLHCEKCDEQLTESLVNKAGASIGLAVVAAKDLVERYACTSCGSLFPADARFCPKCGRELPLKATQEPKGEE